MLHQKAPKAHAAAKAPHHQKHHSKMTKTKRPTAIQVSTTTTRMNKTRHMSTIAGVNTTTENGALNRGAAFFTPTPPSPSTWTAFSASTSNFTPYSAQTLPHKQFLQNAKDSRNSLSNTAFSGIAFRHSRPQRFVGRILLVAGLVSVGLGARYLVRGGSAFFNAYRDTAQNLRPVQEDDVQEASAEIADAAREVVDKAEEEDAVEEQRQERLREKEYEKEHPKEHEQSGPKFYNDEGVGVTYDKEAGERKKREEEEKVLNTQRYESNEEELAMNEVFDKWEQVFQSAADGFPEELSVLDAERILQCSPNPCLEELKERRAVMMRLNHPDMGGSAFLASKVNEAFEKLKLSAKSDPTYAARRQKEKDDELERRKEVLRQFEEERLKKEGVLDEDGAFHHPDGTTGKRYDGSEEKDPKH